MNKLIKGTVGLLGFPLFKLYKNTLVRLIKNEALGYYVRTIKTARKLFLGAVLFFMCLGLLVSGFLMIHIGAFMYVSINLSEPDWALFGLCVFGIGYMLLSFIVLTIACREKTWLKATKYIHATEKE